jgi:hypothetical protein
VDPAAPPDPQRRCALDVGADIEEATGWINAAKADRIEAEAVLRGMARPTV